MAVITKISMQVKNKTRANVFLDGEFAFGADIFTLTKHRIKEGDVVEREDLDEVIFESEAAAAFERSMNIINIRPRTEKEIRRYLSEKEFSERAADAAIEKLKEYRYIDDRAFCDFFIASHRKTRGIKRLEYDLKGYGVDPELIAESIAEAGPQGEEACNLAAKYARQKGVIDKSKIYAFMYGKGFTSDEISTAITRLIEEQEDENNE